MTIANLYIVMRLFVAHMLIVWSIRIIYVTIIVIVAHITSLSSSTVLKNCYILYRFMKHSMLEQDSFNEHISFV